MSEKKREYKRRPRDLPELDVIREALYKAPIAKISLDTGVCFGIIQNVRSGKSRPRYDTMEKLWNNFAKYYVKKNP